MDTLKCPVCGTESLMTVVSKTNEGGLRQFCKSPTGDAPGTSAARTEIAGAPARLLIYAESS